MSKSLRKKILEFLTSKETPISGDDIATEIEVKKKKVRVVLSGMKKKKMIIAIGDVPFKYVINDKIDLNDPENIVPSKEFDKGSKCRLNKHMIMYFTKGLNKPKWLHDFKDSDEVITKCITLQSRKDIVEIAVYKRVDCYDKVVQVPDI